MKASIHPKYNQATQVVCSCGNMFTIGSTQEKITIELCNRCHPFYTGQQKFVDTASRIDKFQKKMEKKNENYTKKTTERKEESRPLTLREMLQSLKK